jgi:hypothetical protein
MLEDPDQRITRPRQLYTGPTRRPYVDISQRQAETATASSAVEANAIPPLPGERATVVGS